MENINAGAVESPQTLSPRLPSFGSLVKKSWEEYKNRFWFLFWICGIPLAITFAATLLPEAFFPLPQILSILGTLFFIVANIAFIYAIKDEGENDFGSVYKKGLRKFFSFWWISILSTFIIFGGVVLLIVPGIILAVSFIFAPYILVNEDIKGLSALLKSKMYVKNFWWAVFGRNLLFALVFIGVIAVVAGIMAIFGSEPLTNLVLTIVQIFLIPLSALFSFSIYKSLMELKPEVASGQAALPKRGLYVFLAILPIIAIIVSIGVAIILIGMSIRDLNPENIQNLTPDQIQDLLKDAEGESQVETMFN